MTKNKLLSAFGLAIVPFLFSCTASGLDGRLDKIEERVTELEAAISSVNDNATTVNSMYRKNLLIHGYEVKHDANGNETGYDLTFSDGTVAHIIFGEKADGKAPILGVDRDGDWAYSIDGGDHFLKVEGADTPGSEDGYTPRMSVDKNGFWTISTDGGQTWQRILNDAGEPISAKDGKSMVPASYSFFKKVTFNETTGNLDIETVSGMSFSIPVKQAASIDLEYYYDGAYAYAGKDVVFPAKISNIDKAVWTSVPDGWRAKLENDKLTVSAPENGNSGDYALKLLAYSNSGQVIPYTFTFSYDPKLIFRDDFVGNDIDYRYWFRHVGGSVRSDWDRYQEGDPEQSFVKDGLLTLMAEKYGDTYRTGAIKTMGLLTFQPPFRIDCSARFTEMADGVWYAIWTAPQAGYMWGEIDIMEKANFGTRTEHTCHTQYTINTTSSRQDQPNAGKGSWMTAGVFNTFSVELTDEAVVYFVNGAEVFRYKNIPHSVEDPGYSKLNDKEKEFYLLNYTFMEQTYFLLLDIAIGGSFPGKTVNDSQLPGQFDIDWISVRKL